MRWASAYIEKPVAASPSRSARAVTRCRERSILGNSARLSPLIHQPCASVIKRSRERALAELARRGVVKPCVGPEDAQPSA